MFCLKNLRDENGKAVFKEMGALSDVVLAGHDTSPTTSDWNKDGVPELLLGAEDGLIYRMERTK